MKPSEILRVGLERFGAGGERWSGYKSNPEHQHYCTATSVSDVDNGTSEFAALDFLCVAIGLDSRASSSEPCGLKDIWGWNDKPERTFPEVKAKFLRAIALAEQAESKDVVSA
jgi:hypothetical protein